MSTFASKGPYQPLQAFSFGARGIVATPASDGARNGWGEPFADETGEPIIPGTVNGVDPQSVLKEPNDEAEEWQDKNKGYLAGNIDWRGAGGEVLTWRGSPTRYFDFVPHYNDYRPGEVWPGQVTWQNPSDPNQNLPNLSFLVGYSTVSKVADDGKTIDGFGWLDGRVIYRKGRAWFNAGSNRRIRGAAVRVHADNTTWLYYIWSSGSAGYVNFETLSRVRVPFDYDEFAREDLATVDYYLTPGYLSGYWWNYANTSPWFFNASCTRAVAIRKRQLNNAGVQTPIHHRYDLAIAESGAANFSDAGACQLSRIDILTTSVTELTGSEAPVPAPRPPPFPGPPSERRDYQNVLTQSGTYTGATVIAYDYEGDTLRAATVDMIGGLLARNDVSDYSAWHLLGEGDVPLETPDTVFNTDWQGTYNETISQILRFDAWLPAITINQDGDSSTVTGLGDDARTTTISQRVYTQIKYMDLRYGILHIKRYGTADEVKIEDSVDIRGDSYVEERLWIKGKIAETTVDENDPDYLYYPAETAPGLLPYTYPPRYADSDPPQAHDPTTTTSYPSALQFPVLLFSASVAVSPSGDHVLASFPVWPEREIENLDAGTWLGNQRYHSAIYGPFPLSASGMETLTKSTGSRFRLHLSGTAGK